MDCSPPGFSIHGIFQARILEWVAISFSRGSSWPRDQNLGLLHEGRLFTVWANRGSLKKKIFFLKREKALNQPNLKKNLLLLLSLVFSEWIKTAPSCEPVGPGFDKDYSVWSVRCCIPWVPTVFQALASYKRIDKWCCWGLPCWLPQDCRRDSKLQTRRTACSVWQTID